MRHWKWFWILLFFIISSCKWHQWWPCRLKRRSVASSDEANPCQKKLTHLLPFLPMRHSWRRFWIILSQKFIFLAVASRREWHSSIAIIKFGKQRPKAQQKKWCQKSISVNVEGLWFGVSIEEIVQKWSKLGATAKKTASVSEKLKLANLIANIIVGQTAFTICAAQVLKITLNTIINNSKSASVNRKGRMMTPMRGSGAWTWTTCSMMELTTNWTRLCPSRI